jgi:peptide/nickel transport system ATP-binding protein
MTSTGTTAAPSSTQIVSEDDVLRVQDLRLNFYTPLGVVRALNGVSFNIPRGKVLGVVGESGCGKSQTGMAVMQLTPTVGRYEGGKVLFQEFAGKEPIDILKLEKNGPEMRHIRGNNISMIFQEPMTSLNPCYTIGNQIEEAILLHQTQDKDEAHRRAIDVLNKVGMPNPERISASFPHQLSGGMRQRAMIAMALSCTPTLLIADEPTTALDVTTEAQILDLMRDLQHEIGTSIMFITHNLGVVAQMCDEVAVMYLGRVVERAPIDDLFYNPKHPYTILLMRSIPRLGVNHGERLESIKGSVPDPYSRVSGCPFHPRCPSAIPGVCDVIEPVEQFVEGSTTHTVRCHLYT